MNAYFDFFTGAEDGYKVARTTVRRYDNYPVSHWKLFFLAIEDQLNDLDGDFADMRDDFDSSSEFTGSDATLRERKQEALKASKKKEPSLSNVAVDEQGVVSVECVNMRSVSVKYYQIDAEVLFSRAPFLKNNAEEFSYVQPCVNKTV